MSAGHDEVRRHAHAARHIGGTLTIRTAVLEMSRAQWRILSQREAKLRLNSAGRLCDPFDVFLWAQTERT